MWRTVYVVPFCVVLIFDVCSPSRGIAAISGGSVVYESTAPAGGGYGLDQYLGHEVGESVSLAGVNRTISEIDLLLWGSTNLEYSVRFYNLDQATGLPSNIIWESPTEFFPTAPPLPSMISISVPDIVVPDSMAWTVVQITPDLTNLTVMTAQSPTVGAFDNYFADDPFPWRNNLFSDGTFYARLVAVPEPSALTLLGLGSLGLLVRRRLA